MSFSVHSKFKYVNYICNHFVTVDPAYLRFRTSEFTYLWIFFFFFGVEHYSKLFAEIFAYLLIFI